MSLKVLASDIVGPIDNPWETINPGAYGGSEGQGLIVLLNNLLKVAIIVAGVWSFINVIIAGYGFMSAGGNPEKISESWSKIWQSLLGLVIVAGSLVMAAVFGQIVFGDPTAIINPRVFGPGGS